VQFFPTKSKKKKKKTPQLGILAITAKQIYLILVPWTVPSKRVCWNSCPSHRNRGSNRLMPVCSNKRWLVVVAMVILVAQFLRRVLLAFSACSFILALASLAFLRSSATFFSSSVFAAAFSACNHQSID
jgi:hypothetical protein